MKRVLIFLVVLLSFSSTMADASIKPVITTKMPGYININLEEVTLSWYVVDDNPKNYSLYINGSIWKDNIPFTSNIVNVTFSNIAGLYNVSLKVMDYSGFTSESFVLIHVNNISVPTYATETSYSTAASDSFSFLEAVMAFISLVLIIKRKYRHKKR